MMKQGPPSLKVPNIAPVPPGTHRPFWSVMIPTYNRSGYLPETLASVLNQDPGPAEMQIEVVDDCSTEDDPEPVLKRLGVLGRVRFSRLSQHVPLSAAFNSCIERATGRWVHILHSDDLVLPRFYRTLREAVETHPEVGAAFSRPICIDDQGHWISIGELVAPRAGILQDCLRRLILSDVVSCPAIVVKREVYEKVGGFNENLYYALDWEMWKRIAASFEFWHEPQPLACARNHALSESSRLSRLGVTLSDVRASIDISRSYLAGDDAGILSNKALEICAISGLDDAGRALWQGESGLAFTLAVEALKCSHSLRVIDRLRTSASGYVLHLIRQRIKALLRLGPPPDKWPQ
jgi:glycosyltransferase involved in cell wall biosynthesis